MLLLNFFKLPELHRSTAPGPIKKIGAVFSISIKPSKMTYAFLGTSHAYSIGKATPKMT